MRLMQLGTPGFQRRFWGRASQYMSSDSIIRTLANYIFNFLAIKEHLYLKQQTDHNNAQFFWDFSNTLSNKQILGWAPSSRDLLRATGHPWNHSKMFLAFSANNNFYCWTFPSVWWCLDVSLLFLMRAVGRPRGSQCTWLRYDCVW